MFKESIVFIYLFIYFLSLGYTQPIALERLTYSDVLLIPVILLSFLKIMFRNKLYLLPIQKIYIVFLFVLFISTTFSYFKFQDEKVFFEFIVHIFSFLIFFSLFQLFYDISENKKIVIVNIWFYAVGVICLVSILDFTTFSIFPHEIRAGGLVGGFRNTGQAGTFISVSLVLGAALYISGYIRVKVIAYFFFFIMLLALILTVKRAAWAGVGLSFVMLILLANNSKNALTGRVILLGFLLISLLFGYFAFEWALENVDGLAWRFEYKVSSYAGSGQSDFIFEQIDKTFSAFYQNPLLGTGLGGVQTLLGSSHEIHNGYLKILVSSGLIGFFVFVFFYFKVLSTLKIMSKKKNRLGKFSNTIFAMLIGLSVSWGYSYPLRKREFWIFLAITFILVSGKKLKQLK